MGFVDVALPFDPASTAERRSAAALRSFRSFRASRGAAGAAGAAGRVHRGTAELRQQALSGEAEAQEGLAMSGAPISVAFSVPATASTTTLGTAFKLPVAYDRMIVIASMASMSAGTLDLYIQESWDQGNTWNDVAHFAQLAAAAPAAIARVAVNPVASGAPVVVGGSTPALAAGKAVEGPWAPTLRIVSVVGAGVNSGPVAQQFTFIPSQQSY